MMQARSDYLDHLRRTGCYNTDFGGVNSVPNERLEFRHRVTWLGPRRSALVCSDEHAKVPQL